VAMRRALPVIAMVWAWNWVFDCRMALR